MQGDPFLWGVATAAYQVEGGINAEGGPANNWAPWDASGRVEPCGDALRFWNAPDELLDRTSALGCNAFRLSIEWARVQPSARSRESTPPEWEPAALDRYADIIVRALDRGLEPVVTLHHFTHPLWCGSDFWLDPASPRMFAAYARRCVTELGRRLADAARPPVRWWLTINEAAGLASGTYFLGMFPGSRRGTSLVARAYDHLVAAHVLAYDAVHDAYAEEGWAPPLVSTNTISMTVVALDALLVDVLLARERGVARDDLRGHLRECHDRARKRLAPLRRRNALSVLADVALDRFAMRQMNTASAAFETLYASPRPRKLDYVSFDYYDAVIGNGFGPAAGAGARALRRRPALAELWEQVVAPDGLAVLLRQAHLQAPDRPILVAENGMCTPGRRPRPDGVTRVEFLRAMCAEVVRARDEGVAVAGYLHWTIADNYEWGSYLPRFGLHGVDRGGRVRILDTDAMGVDAAATYRDVIAQDGERTSRGRRGGGEKSGASAL